MPRNHPLSKDLLLLKKKARQRTLYLAQKQQFAKDLRQTAINKREAFAKSAGRVVIGWTVEQELQLLNEYRHTCSYCDLQKDDLDLTLYDLQGEFRIENMLPICQACLVTRFEVTVLPLQITKYLPIAALPTGFNKERLTLFCEHENVKIYVVARLLKQGWRALIGWPLVDLLLKPQYRYQFSFVQAKTRTPQQVRLYGDYLFENEARVIFPEYQALAYLNLFIGE